MAHNANKMPPRVIVERRGSNDSHLGGEELASSHRPPAATDRVAGMRLRGIGADFVQAYDAATLFEWQDVAIMLLADEPPSQPWYFEQGLGYWRVCLYRQHLVMLLLPHPLSAIPSDALNPALTFLPWAVPVGQPPSASARLLQRALTGAPAPPAADPSRPLAPALDPGRLPASASNPLGPYYSPFDPSLFRPPPVEFPSFPSLQPFPGPGLARAFPVAQPRGWVPPQQQQTQYARAHQQQVLPMRTQPSHPRYAPYSLAQALHARRVGANPDAQGNGGGAIPQQVHGGAGGGRSVNRAAAAKPRTQRKSV